MLKDNLNDAGEIIDNIISQPLSIPGARKNISLLEAAKAYNPHEPMTSDLRKILLSLLQFPEPTDMMIQELELLQNSLTKS